MLTMKLIGQSVHHLCCWLNVQRHMLTHILMCSLTEMAYLMCPSGKTCKTALSCLNCIVNSSGLPGSARWSSSLSKAAAKTATLSSWQFKALPFDKRSFWRARGELAPASLGDCWTALMVAWSASRTQHVKSLGWPVVSCNQLEGPGLRCARAHPCC